MPFLTSRLLLLALALAFGGCATRSLPKYEKPIARTQFQTVRTTAYTHSEADHRQYGRKTAMGSQLQASGVRSAAADWSRWPAGTTFRILETDEYYRVEDYGWALTGTNTIDLYKPSRGQMNAWGVRRVNIEVMNWGDPDRSLAILRPRDKHRHVRKMIAQLEDRRSELLRPVPTAAPRVAYVEPAASGTLLTPFATSSVR